MGSYLRTNYRVTGRELDTLAIGGGVLQGSWGSGPGTRREFGGFVMGSVDGAAHSAGGIVDIETFDAMSAFYGDAYVTMFDSGYRIFPIAVWHMGTASHRVYQWSVSGTAANDSVMYIKCYALSEGSTLTGPSGNAHFAWAGFIVSTP